MTPTDIDSASEVDDLESRLRATFRAVHAATPAGVVPQPPTTSMTRHQYGEPALGGLRTRRVLLGGLAVAGVGTAVAAVVGSRTVTPSAAAAARSALHRAARNVRAASFVAPRPDQYLYSRTVSTFYVTTNTNLQTAAEAAKPGSTWFLISQINDRWEPVDPARAGRQTFGAPTFLRPGDRQKALAMRCTRADGRFRIDYSGPPQLGPHTWGNNFTAPSWPFLASLPTDVGTLYRRVESYSRGGGSSLHAEMLVTIDDALRGTLAPPAVAAALYEVAARIPGITLVPGAVDLDGRRGVAVTTDAGNSRQEMIFDDATGTFLGHRYVLLRPWQGHPPGTVISSDATTVSIVDAIGDR